MIQRQVIKTLSGKEVYVESHNPRLLRAGPLEAMEEFGEDGSIVRLSFYEEIVFEIGSLIKINKQVYKIYKITKNTDVGNKVGIGYHLLPQVLTKSSLLIMPLLGYDRRYFKWEDNFCNCFVGTELKGDYAESIYLLFRFGGQREFSIFEENLQAHPWFLGMADVDKYQVLYQFGIPTDFEDDYQLILDGKYSQLSPKAKEQILKFHNTSIDRPIGQILTKAPARKRKLESDLDVIIHNDAELWDKFYAEQEIFLECFKITDDGEGKYT